MLNTSDTIRSAKTDDGRLLLDVHHGQMFSLNRAGSRILELLEQGWDEARIAEEISRSYAMSVEVVRTDVREFVEALRRHHILNASSSVDSTS
jgi:DNA-binding CsgD family transcriptional regulator